MKRRYGALIWLLCGLCASVAFGKPGVVKTSEGQTYSGEIEEKDADTIIVKSGRIETTIARNRIASIEYAQDFEKQFRDRLSKLDPKDAAGRLQLAREAFDAKQYPLAREAAEGARQIDPNNADAISMLGTVQSQIRLERAQQQQQETATAPAGRNGTAAGDATTTQPINEKVLKPDQINAIRQAELRPEDAGVRVRFDRDVKRRFMQHQSLQPANINAMTTNDLVQEIIKKGTPEMRRDVLILNDPPSLFQYRRVVQPFVLQNCATAGCHGSINPASISLVTPGDSDAAAYTNFYLLNQYAKRAASGGNNVFGPGDLRAIDRQRPDQSLLLQYALPGAISEYDHPDVPGYRPPFRGLNDPRYVSMLSWIAESLVAVPPDYGFTFGPGATSEPATQAATAPAETQPAPATRPMPRPPPRVTPPPAAQPRPRNPHNRAR